MLLEKFKFILFLLVCLLLPIAGNADDSSPLDIAELLRSYTYLLINYPQFNPLKENCSGWEKDFCTLQRELEKYRTDLETGLGFVKHISYIPEVDVASNSSGQTCFTECSEKDTLYLSSPLPKLGGSVIAVLSSTRPWNTWIFMVRPDLTVKILYYSYDEKTWSLMQPRGKIGNVRSVRIDGSSLQLIQDEGPGHSHVHTKYVLSLPFQ